MKEHSFRLLTHVGETVCAFWRRALCRLHSFGSGVGVLVGVAPLPADGDVLQSLRASSGKQSVRRLHALSGWRPGNRDHKSTHRTSRWWEVFLATLRQQCWTDYRLQPLENASEGCAAGKHHICSSLPFFTSGTGEGSTPLKNAQASFSHANFLKEAAGNLSTWLLHSSLTEQWNRSQVCPDRVFLPQVDTQLIILDLYRCSIFMMLFLHIC